MKTRTLSTVGRGHCRRQRTCRYKDYNCSEWWQDREFVDTEHPQLLEVSVGYWHQTRPQAGEFDGERYSQEAYDLHPDHLALLPHKTGQCSVADGCGAPGVSVECGVRLLMLTPHSGRCGR